MAFLPLMLGVACFTLFTVGAGTLSLDGITLERGGKTEDEGLGEQSAIVSKP